MPSGNLVRVNFYSWLRGKLDGWRVALLVFLLVYGFLLLVNLGYMAIQWDEIPHLYGGLLLFHGQTQAYMATYGYYPPLYDIVTTGFNQVLGVSAATGRLTAVMFSLLSIWITFEFAKRTYGPKIALVSAVMLGVMPGFFWLSRVAMLETVLIFFFTLTLFFFFTWLSKHKDRALLLSCVALGVGFLAKYQILVAGVVMVFGILWLGRDKLKLRFTKFLLVPLIAVAVVVPWLVVLYQTNGANNFGQLLYVLQEGGQDRAQYSARFPAPIFYLIEMTWPFNDVPVHPISLPLYVLGLCGLGLWAWRRKPEDKFFLAWFVVVYVFFTLIPNKQWRYVTPIFPVLAISAASFIFFAYGKLAQVWKREKITLSKKSALQVATGFLVVFALVSVVYSSNDVYQMVARDQIHIPIDEAASYVADKMNPNDSLMVLCAINLFNQDMVKFYLQAADSSKQNEVLQYPVLPVDAFTPSFNVTELVGLCRENNVKYALLYEYGGDFPYFQSNLNAMQVYGNLTSNNLGNFTDEHRVGVFPRTITIFSSP
jgi:4-amino-4-deoxy-L-arabinose transferase-like glycosyltransferase